MSFEVKIIKDTISPKLAQLIRECANPRKVLEAMGERLVSVTKRAFNDPSLRPQTWPPVKKKSGAPLKKSGAMYQSIRVVNVTNNSVTVGSDRTYAACHQFGTKRIPARPFFPFDTGGKMIANGRQKVEAAAKVALAALLKA